MKVYLIQYNTKDGVRFHAYDQKGSLGSAKLMQDAARFHDLIDAQNVAKQYATGTVLGVEIDEFAHRVRIMNHSGYPMPKYAKYGDSGMDVRAAIQEPHTLKPLERGLIPTGLFAELPVGFEIQVRPKSGLAHKHGITVMNTPGTVDQGYRGEIKVNLVNLSNEEFIIKPGEWIAQIVLAQVERMALIQADELSETERGEGGHGSTGTGVN